MNTTSRMLSICNMGSLDTFQQEDVNPQGSPTRRLAMGEAKVDGGRRTETSGRELGEVPSSRLRVVSTMVYPVTIDSAADPYRHTSSMRRPLQARSRGDTQTIKLHHHLPYLPHHASVYIQDLEKGARRRTSSRVSGQKRPSKFQQPDSHGGSKSLAHSRGRRSGHHGRARRQYNLGKWHGHRRG